LLWEQGEEAQNTNERKNDMTKHRLFTGIGVGLGCALIVLFGTAAHQQALKP
jgi:hypothetical protein